MNNNFYEVLGIANTATLREIKEAFRLKCAECHPSVVHEGDEFLYYNKMYRINEAYRILSDIDRRKTYDEYLESLDRKSKPERSQAYIDSLNSYTYNYYNDSDYDKEEQKEFIGWLNDFAFEYLEDTWSRLFISNEISIVYHPLEEQFCSISESETNKYNKMRNTKKRIFRTLFKQ